MLLQLLKALGLDVAAQIAQWRTRVERRVEEAADQAREAVRAAVVTAALAGAAAAMAAAAIGIGLVALDRWAADSFGPFVGYGIVAGVLVFVSVVLGIVAFVRSRSPRRAATEGPRVDNSNAAAVPSPAPGKAEGAAASPVAAGGWAKVLVFLLSLLMKPPAAGGSLVDELAATVRLGASGETDRALEGATAMVREGDRANLLAAVAGAALLGWMIARQWQRPPR